MFDRIDSRLPTPLYMQIASAVRLAIAAGELAPGDGVPSVRTLATQLRVNPATVAQAYRHLEQEQLIEMRQGAGSFVREIDSERQAQERHSEFTQQVRALLGEGARLGFAREQIESIINEELSQQSSQSTKHSPRKAP